MHASVAPAHCSPRLLVINPNTSAAVTALLHQHIGVQIKRFTVHSHPPPAPLALDAISARFGPAYISSEVAYTIASHACLDAWAHAIAPYDSALPLPWDGVLIGCFGDPGLLALRELAPIPVSGLAEGAFAVASRHGRFGIVTGGERWKPMLHRLAQALHCDHALADITTVSLTGAQLMADRPAALALLTRACQQLQHTHAVDAIILGGAALTGMATDIQAQLNVPLIDSVHAATAYLCEQIPQPQKGEKNRSNTPRSTPEAAVSWSGLSPELSQLLAHRA